MHGVESEGAMPKIGVIVGSIRKDSLNKKLATALEVLGRGKLDFVRLAIDDLPLFNQDDEKTPPAEVRRFKSEIAKVDGILFVTPEHNRSIPAAMKNAFDWGSRPRGENVWRNKVGAVIGTSDGSIGTAVAQQHLKTIVGPHLSALLGFPEAYIVFKEGLIDEQGNISDDSTRKFLQSFVDNFARLANAMSKT
jgi:chromate reductase